MGARFKGWDITGVPRASNLAGVYDLENLPLVSGVALPETDVDVPVNPHYFRTRRAYLHGPSAIEEMVRAEYHPRRY